MSSAHEISADGQAPALMVNEKGQALCVLAPEYEEELITKISLAVVRELLRKPPVP